MLMKRTYFEDLKIAHRFGDDATSILTLLTSRARKCSGDHTVIGSETVIPVERKS